MITQHIPQEISGKEDLVIEDDEHRKGIIL